MRITVGCCDDPLKTLETNKLMTTPDSDDNGGRAIRGQASFMHGVHTEAVIDNLCDDKIMMQQNSKRQLNYFL